MLCAEHLTKLGDVRTVLLFVKVISNSTAAMTQPISLYTKCSAYDDISVLHNIKQVMEI